MHLVRGREDGSKSEAQHVPGATIAPTAFSLPSPWTNYRMVTMRSVLALTLVVGIYVVGPAICLSSTEEHTCACDQAACPCVPSDDAHQCHDDPCPDDTIRPEDDSSDQPAPLPCSERLAALLTHLSADEDVPASTCSSRAAAPVSLSWREVFAFQGLPLLI